MSVHARLTHRPALIRLLCALALATSALLLMYPPTAAAATFTVTKTTDSKDGLCNSDCSLREAIIAAHQQPGSDTITLPAGMYLLTLSDIDITSNLAIMGAGAVTTIVDGNDQDRVFEVRPGITVTIENVQMRNGKPSQGNGGGILNNGILTLINTTVRANIVSYPAFKGGGISNTGTLTITNSTISFNEATGGGGIYNSGTLAMIQSTGFRNGSSDDGGGGILNTRAMTIITSTIRDNSSYRGGGIRNNGTATIATSTIRDNDVSFGGGGITQTTVRYSTWAILPRRGAAVVRVPPLISVGSPGLRTVTATGSPAATWARSSAEPERVRHAQTTSVRSIACALP